MQEREICASNCMSQPDASAVYGDTAWRVHVCLLSEFPYRVCAMSPVPSSLDDVTS